MENDFKSGDRVGVSRNNPYEPLGTRGTVIKTDSNRVLIEFDNSDKCWLFAHEIVRIPIEANPQ